MQTNPRDVGGELETALFTDVAWLNDVGVVALSASMCNGVEP